jgi:hypothetical protein
MFPATTTAEFHSGIWGPTQCKQQEKGLRITIMVVIATPAAKGELSTANPAYSQQRCRIVRGLAVLRF